MGVGVMGRITLRTYLEEKPICIVCNGATVKDDLIFSKKQLGHDIGYFTHIFSFGSGPFKDISIENTKFVTSAKHLDRFKHKMLWLWHITILRKDYVYLTGANK